MTKGYCKNCDGITEGQSRGDHFFCKECRGWTGRKVKAKSSRLKNNGYNAEYVVTTEKRIVDEKDIISLCNIDTKIWQVDRFEVGSSEGYRKDRQVEWEVTDGKVTHGKVNDTGKLLIAPLHTVRVWVSRKTEEIRNQLVVNDFIRQAKKYAPTYKKINYKKSGDCLFELGLPDLQLGRLVAAEDVGHNLDPDMQIGKAEAVVNELIGYAQNFKIKRVLFPVGNDFFDSNSAIMETAHGTPQLDDVRWKRTYKLGCSFIVKTIDKLMQIAPVDILIVPGNHDEDKIFHLGEYIEAWHHKDVNVIVDNRPIKRKYYQFGSNLIGFTHGYYEKNDRLDSLMAFEVPELWAKSTHREWHLGDKHHKVDMLLKTNELNSGVVIRILRSLATPSIWEYDKGLVGSQKSAEAFLWHPVNGLVAQFTAS